METEPGIEGPNKQKNPDYPNQDRVDIEKRKRITMRELQGMGPENAEAEEFLEELELKGTLLDKKKRDRQLSQAECGALVRDAHSILETMLYLEKQLNRADLSEEIMKKLDGELEENRRFALGIEKACGGIFAVDMKQAILEDVANAKSVYLRIKEKSGL